MAAKINCPGIFITGTDTGVGKTLVTAALSRHFTGKGLKVGVVKPIETGVANPKALGPDAALLRWACNATDPDDTVSPYRYEKPLAPCQAASESNRPIDIEKIITSHETLASDKDLVLVEGAGGLMVPIRGGYIMADLARQLNMPLLIITHPRLGTLNHTLLTTFAARAMELEICGYLINRMPGNPGDAEKQAPHLLASLASADLLGVLPEVSGSDQDKVEALAATIEELPAYQWLLNALGILL